jgi:large subunit ribosomal protein L3
VKTAEKKKIGLLGRKAGMTMIFSPDGEQVPVTVIEAGPCVVVQTREAEKDGYDAVQLGFEEVTKNGRVSKPMAGLFGKAGVKPHRILSEIRNMDPGSVEVGQELTADLFELGETVKVQGHSKGRGFSGGVKRHGYSGGKATHGSMFHRAPGSIGCSAWPSRVFKGKRMPGRYGNDRVTVKGLRVMGVDAEKGILLVKGAVPGARSGLVVITAERG